MSKSLIPKMKKRCKDCPPMVVPPRSYTPSRPSCLECVEKHLGAAYVLLTELNDLPDPPSSIGSGVGKAYQADGTMPDWETLTQRVQGVRDTLP